MPIRHPKMKTNPTTPSGSEDEPLKATSGTKIGKMPEKSDKGITSPGAGPGKAEPEALTLQTSPSSLKVAAITNLTKFEVTEIKSYPCVYFTGLPMKKKNHHNVETADIVFDDEHGYYKGQVGDHLEYRYEILESSGRGNFSEVFKARDHKPRPGVPTAKLPKVAVKIIREQDNKQKTQLQQEIDMLYFLRRGDPKNNQCIIRLFRTFWFRNHFCIVFDCLYLDLYSYMEQNNFAGLEPAFLRSVSAYILRGLEYLYLCGVIHADLKPENIVLCSPKDARVKLVDFGWSWLEDTECKFSTDYFQSRFSRAPEVILGGPLTTAVDMWSYGCILAELAFGTPVFQGEDRHDQLSCIVEVLGLPPTEIMEWRRSKNYFSSDMQPFYCYAYEEIETGSPDQNFVFLMGCVTDSGDVRGVPGSKHIIKEDGGQLEPEYREAFTDFLLQCFTWVPGQRWTPVEASYHRWISTEYRKIEEMLEKDPKKKRPIGGVVSSMRHKMKRKRARIQRQKHQPPPEKQKPLRRKQTLAKKSEHVQTDAEVIRMMKTKYEAYKVMIANPQRARSESLP